MNKFDGPFSEHIINFIKYKQNLGYKYESAAQKLYNFDQYTKSYDETILTKDLVCNWITKNPNNNLNTIKGNACLLREFGKYMNSINSNNFILPIKMFSKTQIFVPHIFTDSEIKLLIKTADNYNNKFYYPKKFIVSLVFKLLYGTGMRISECLNIKIKDINFEDGIIFLEKTKNGKDRLIVLNEYLRNECITFHSKFNKNISIDYPFFRNEYDKCFSPNSFDSIFHKILKDAKIDTKGARLHDLRHTFAVHTLRKFVIEGKDLNVYLPILSAYLGHTRLSSTEKYLRLTADMYDDIRAKVEKEYSNLIKGEF